jgi:hypothetical protein
VAPYVVGEDGTAQVRVDFDHVLLPEREALNLDTFLLFESGPSRISFKPSCDGPGVFRSHYWLKSSFVFFDPKPEPERQPERCGA